MQLFVKIIRLIETNCLVFVKIGFLSFIGVMPFVNTLTFAEEIGVSNTVIRIGGVMDLTGDAKDLGLGLKNGIEAALKNEKIQGRMIEYIVMNDSYTPEIAAKETKQLIERGVFAFLGNMGTSTAKETLPLLVDQKIPAIGFYTGGEFLRSSMGDVVNFRPSYVQEVASVIEAALAAGVRPQQICAYVQNDEYGMAGIQAMKHQFQKLTGMSETVQKLEQIATMQGTEPVRNDIGPVGVYTRNTLAVKEGYDSLKKWEKKSGTSCQLIATVGTYLAVDKFIGYARYKGEKWVISVASPTNTTSDFVRTLKEQKINGLIATGVVPALDSTLPIVEEARKSLQSQINPVSLEGFIVGKMFLAIMRNIKGDITRSNFIKAVKGQVYDIGGLKLDFTTDNQGSDYVYMSYFNGEEFKPLSPQQFSAIFKP